MRKYRVEPANGFYPEVEKEIKDISIEAGLKKPPEFYVLDVEKPESFVFGRWKSDARLVLSRGLIENLSSVELDGVIAHEIGHILNNDIWFVSWAQLLFDSLKYWFVLFSVVGFTIVYIRESRLLSVTTTFFDVGLAMFLQTVPLYFAFLVIFPWIILNSTTRTRELLADARASIFGKTHCLIQALKQISAVKGKIVIKKGLRSPKYLSITPSGLVKPSRNIILQWLFNSHPRDDVRIDALRDDKYVITEDKLSLPSFTTAVYIGVISFYLGIILGNVYGALVGIRHVSPISSYLTFGALQDIGFVTTVSPILAVLLNLWTWRHSTTPRLGFMSMLSRILLSMIALDLLFNLIFIIPKSTLLVIYERRVFFKTAILILAFIIVSLYVDKWIKTLYNKLRHLRRKVLKYSE